MLTRGAPGHVGPSSLPSRPASSHRAPQCSTSPRPHRAGQPAPGTWPPRISPGPLHHRQVETGGQHPPPQEASADTRDPLTPSRRSTPTPCHLTPTHAAAHARAGRQGTGLHSPSGLTGWSSRPSSLSSPRARVTLCSCRDKSPSDVGRMRQPQPRPRSPRARPARHPCIHHAARGRL